MLKTAALLVVLAVVGEIDAQNKYCDLCPNNDHTMCLYSGPGPACKDLGKRRMSAKERQEIVDVHNKYRAMVASGQQNGQPPAANMRQMSWDREIARVAQRWADQCKFDHDTCRDVKRFSVGQNAYVMPVLKKGTPANWTAAVELWYNEVKDFDPSGINPFVFDPNTGHYTQVVWAETYKVGCGFAQYMGDDGYYQSLQICDYGPAGNVGGGSGVMYKEGEACSDCLPGTTVCQDSLCV